MDRIKSKKVLLLILMDIVLINLAYVSSIFYRFNYENFSRELQFYKSEAIIITCIYIAVFYIFKLYDSLWRYAGSDELLLVFGGCVASDILGVLYVHFADKPLHLSVHALAGIFTVI